MLRILVQLSLLLWQVLSTGVRVFAYDSVKGGLLDMRPMERGNRAPIVVALIAIMAMLAAIVFADQLRALLPLEPLAIASTTTRGILVPTLAVPVTLVALVLAWSLILAGAVRMHIAIRVMAVAAFLMFGAPALNDIITATAPMTITAPLLAVALNAVAVVASLCLLAAIFLLGRHMHADWLDFVVVLSFVTLFTLPGVIAYSYVRGDAYADPMGQADSLASGLSLAVVLLAPFRMISGLEMANLAGTVTSWMMRAAWRRTGRAFAVGVLFVALGVRLALAAADIDFGAALPWAAWAGAALHLGGVGLLALAFRHRGSTGVDSFAPMVAAIVAYVSVNILLTPTIQAVTSGFLAFGVVTGQLQSTAANADAALRIFSAASDAYSRYAQLILAGGAAATAAWLFRQRRASASIMAALAWTALTRWFTSVERPLHTLRWEPAHIDLLFMLALAAISVTRLLQRRLDEATALRLLGLVIVFALLGQSSFLDNPFSPLAAIAGVVVLVVGITWNIVTSGGRFLNADSPAFPRWSRATAYFGYVLLSVAVAHWFITTHTVWQQALQSFMTQGGFELFGYAVVWRLCIERGAGLALVNEDEN
jgi:hypothetical protein